MSQTAVVVESRVSASEQLAAQGDFERVYARFYRFVRGVLRQLHVPETDADDLAQETFIVLLRKLEDGTAPERLRPWLYQVARRVASNHRRGEGRESRKRQQTPVPLAADCVPTPEEQLAMRETVRSVESFLETLGPIDRRIFFLSEIEQHRGPEIARRLELNLNTTYSRIRAVRGKFERAMASRERPERRSWVLGVFGLPTRRSVLAGAGIKVVLVTIAALLALLGFLSGGGGDLRGPGAPAPGVPIVQADADETGDALAAERIALPGGTARIAGSVVDDAGSPIAGASVCADRGAAGLNQLANGYPVTADAQHPITCTQTDEHGRFSLARVFAGDVVLHAGARGYVPRRHVDQPGVTGLFVGAGGRVDGVRIELARGGVELRGTVEDLYGGPVAGARVTLVEGAVFAASGALTVESDESGQFSMWVRPGNTTLFVHADGYARSSFFVSDREPTLRLGAEGVLEGVVVTADGDPLPNTLLAAVPKPVRNMEELVLVTGWSDATGHFRLAGLRPADYEIQAGTTDWFGSTPLISVGLGETVGDVVATLEPALSFRGRVVADDGEPCRRGRVVMADAYPQIGTVDPDGRFELYGIQPDASYTLHVECEGMVSLVQPLTTTSEPPEPRDWVLSRGKTLRGRVVDADGHGVAGWRVAVEDADRIAGAHIDMGAAITDASGEFTLRGVSAGDHSLRASGEGFVAPDPVRVEVSADADPAPIRVTLQRGATIFGRVVAPDGVSEPPSVSLRLAPGPTDPSTHRALLHRARVDASGEFRFEHLAAGRYEVWAERDGQALGLGIMMAGPRPSAAPATEVSVTGTEHREVELRFETPAVSMRGRVVYPDGSPVADAAVHARAENVGTGSSEGEGYWRMDHQPVLTGSEGEFELTGLDPDRAYRVLAFTRDGERVSTPDVHPTDGEALRLVLAPTGTLSGTVLDPDGEPVPGFWIHTHNLDTGFRKSVGYNDPTGAWAMPGLPAGRYEVTIQSGRGRGEATGVLEAGGEAGTGVVRLVRE